MIKPRDERLRKLGTFFLEKRRLKNYTTALFRNLKGYYKEKGQKQLFLTREGSI